MNNTKEYIVIHHSVSNRDNTTVQDIDSWHKERWINFKSSLGEGFGETFQKKRFPQKTIHPKNPIKSNGPHF